MTTLTETADGRAAGNALIAPERLRVLARRSDRRGGVQLARHAALIVLGGALVTLTRDSVWLTPALFLHGLTLVSLFAVLHETVHFTAFRTRRVNAVVAWFAGLVMMLNSTQFRYFHYAHHRHCQDPARDPELTPPPPATRRAYLWRVSGLPYWLGQLRQNVAIAFGDFAAMDYVPRGARRAVRRSVLGYWLCYGVVLAVSLAAQSGAALWYWLLPMLLAQPCLRLYLLAEHTGCSHDDNGLSNTRTVLTHPAVRGLMWNMPYHAEHHLLPQLPFHALPRAHPLLRARLTELAPGYRAVHGRLWRQLAS